jgi:hypothetical protein
MSDILLILSGENRVGAIEAAFGFAHMSGGRLVVLQICDSDLYHYGHNDLIATRPSKAQFLHYIRGQVLERAEAEAEELRKKGRDMGLSAEIISVETDDVLSTVLEEARKGYEVIFMVKETSRLFPLLKRRVASHLRKRVSTRVVECI